MLYAAQDKVAAEVTESHARLQSATARVVQADRALRTAIITFNGNFEGLQQTMRFGDVLGLVYRPQEAVYALDLMNLAFNEYFSTVADYNRAQFELFHALGYPARELTIVRLTGRYLAGGHRAAGLSSYGGQWAATGHELRITSLATPISNVSRSRQNRPTDREYAGIAVGDVEECLGSTDSSPAGGNRYEVDDRAKEPGDEGTLALFAFVLAVSAVAVHPVAAQIRRSKFRPRKGPRRAERSIT